MIARKVHRYFKWQKKENKSKKIDNKKTESGNIKH